MSASFIRPDSRDLKTGTRFDFPFEDKTLARTPATLLLEVLCPIGRVTLNSLADNIVRPISDASINLQIQTFTHLVKGNKEFKDANESGQQQLDVRAVNIGTPPKVDGVCQLDVSTFHQPEYHLSEVDLEECYLKDQRYVSDVVTVTPSSVKPGSLLFGDSVNMTFPNRDASTAFAFVLDSETTKKCIGSRCFAPENAVEQLDLQLSFIDFRSGQKLKVSLDMTCLKCGVYPLDTLHLRYMILLVANYKTSMQETLPSGSGKRLVLVSHAAWHGLIGSRQEIRFNKVSKSLDAVGHSSIVNMLEVRGFHCSFHSGNIK
ncbi:Cyclic nucleotide-gated cation channel like [Quillaja saponaria]|uniref:Cyclic nucleotide-gated cation channel like n=1 Tax=Quillaja saponaria TaxID=32244 RepID=A0AAD7PQX7_QUISA|nr:Cyclic nucleotide-gated cation channel like [Quillaja saponaria]